MRTDELDYELPSELIAQTPLEPRDASRLLVVSGRGADLRLADAGFVDLAGLLAPGDVLVRNDTRVVPARTRFRRATGARIEVLFLEPVLDGDRAAARADGVGPARAVEWEALVRGRPREGETLVSEAGGDEFRVELRRRLGDGRWRIACLGDEPPARLLARFGETPLPPYIRADLDDADRYQTVYAAADGSAAAPTAGLHFTAAAGAALRARGIAIEQLTLHVGLATFKPVTADDLEDHPLHDEPFIVREDVWRRIDDAAADGPPRRRRRHDDGAPARRAARRQRDGRLDWSTEPSAGVPGCSSPRASSSRW